MKVSPETADLAWKLSSEVIDEMVVRLRAQFVDSAEFSDLGDPMLAMVLGNAVRQRFDDPDLLAGLMGVLLVRELRAARGSL